MKIENLDIIDEIIESSGLTSAIGEDDKRRLAKNINAYSWRIFIRFFKSIIPTSYAISGILLFTLSNYAVWWLVRSAFLSDINFINAGKSIPRLITPEVIMALITGISVQTATAFLIITKYFFGGNKKIDTILSKTP